MTDSAESQIVLKSGARSKVVTFLKTHLEKNVDDLSAVQLKLWQMGPDARTQVASWPADRCAQRPGDFADEVIDLVRQRTEIAGSRSEFNLEATSSDGEVLRSYPLVAQPATNNLSPTPEGMVHLAMRQTDSMVRTVLQDRQAATEAYRDVIAMQREEIERLVGVVRMYQAREDAAHERELRLMDRERALLTREASSDADSRERADDRLDRVAEKIGDALESGAVALARGAAERMDPKDATGLVRELAPLVAKIVGE